MNGREAIDVQASDFPAFAASPLPGTHVSSHGPGEADCSPPVGGALKRGFDIAFATVTLLLVAPLMVLIALSIWLHDRGPVFYGQSRIGHRGRSFRCLKFRSMVPNADAVLRELLERDPEARLEWQTTHKLKDDPRCTAFGRFLRRTSLDELPQLINVMRGDMSLVGPRPIVLAETRFYGNELAAYHRARPGVTGLWQVSGRSDTSYETRVNLDSRYVRDWSFGSDIAILMRTVAVVLSSKGSY
jgi:Undecaprenyl-phosphate galactose phosphotransferase WbaP